MATSPAGIPAFYTPTGVGTPIAEGEPEAAFDGQRCILERGRSKGPVSRLRGSNCWYA